MTKPSYEERLKELTQTLADEHKLRQAAQNETERVRGLLQRQWISVEERLPREDETVLVFNRATKLIEQAEYSARKFIDTTGTDTDLTPVVAHWMPQPDPPQATSKVYCGDCRRDVTTDFEHKCEAVPTFPQSSSLVSQGAESADIGKLDAADKSMCKCGHSDEEHDDGRLCCSHRQSASLMCLCDKFEGTAETGGEKAEEESRKPEIFLSLHSNGGFFRDRRDMTIRLLADYKSFLSPNAGSREPEKLNNAHQCLNRSSYDANRRCSKVSQHSGECVFPARAESSLSKTIDATGENPSF